MVNPFDVDTADAAAIRERLEDGAGSEDGDSAQVDNVMAATAAVKRAARPKLTADLLLDRERGLHYVRTNGPKIKFEGKGNEAEDLNRVMRFYKAWAHQLFPRAPFKEFVYKSQKLCRERRMRAGLEGMYHEYRFGASGTNLSGETVGEGRGGVYGRDGDNRDGDGNVSHGDAFHEDVELDRAMAEANVRVGAPLNNGAAAVAAAEISAEQLARIQENRERVVKRRFGDHASERTDDPHLKQALARMAERQRLREAEEAMKRRQEEEEQDAAMRMLNDVDAEAMGGLPDEDEEAMAMEMEKRDLEMQQRDLDMERTTVAHVDAETEADNAPIDLIEEQE